MLEKVDLSLALDKQTYKEALPKLQERLRACQNLAMQHKIPVVILFEGWDAAGKDTNISLLTEKLDPRHFKVHSINAATDEEKRRPWMWRYWRKLPPNGDIAIFDRSWYGRVLVERVDKLASKKEWQRAYDEIDQFERQLSDDGTLIAKFWMHISKKEQKRRFKKIAADDTLSWMVTKEDWRHHEEYREYEAAVEEMLARTSTHWAPWTIVEAEDKRYGAAKIHETIIRAVEEEAEQIRRTAGANGSMSAAGPVSADGAAAAARRSSPAGPGEGSPGRGDGERSPAPDQGGPSRTRAATMPDARSAAALHPEADPTPPGTNPARRPPAGTHPIESAAVEVANEAQQPPGAEPEEFGVIGRSTLLDQVDLTQSVPREEYKEKLQPLQAKLRRLQHEIVEEGAPAVLVVYEGWDAAGKGGNIKRLTQFLDPHGYSVIAYAAPTAEEKRHHYLWRFWRDLPGGGEIAIFDRSWYGRVLVERVEGFATENEWRRAYQEINEFEGQLTNGGVALVKLWLQISPDEQLRRFEDRATDQYRHWKLTDEDWRNREKLPQYREAVIDMLEKTSTAWAPWTIVEANDKPHARIKAVRTVIEAIESALG